MRGKDALGKTTRRKADNRRGRNKGLKVFGDVIWFSKNQTYHGEERKGKKAREKMEGSPKRDSWGILPIPRSRTLRDSLLKKGKEGKKLGKTWPQKKKEKQKVSQGNGMKNESSREGRTASSIQIKGRMKKRNDSGIRGRLVRVGES